MEEEENYQQLKCMESQTRFFKIVLHHTLQSKKLVIPRSFVQKYGRDLCLGQVYLKVPSGDIWEVGLHTEEDGNSEFEVLMFDKTTTEIKYPCKSKINKNHNADVDPCLFPVKPEMEERDVVEMLVDDDASKINNLDKNTACMIKGSGDCDYISEELWTSKSFCLDESREKAESIIRSKDFHSPNPYFRIIMRSTYVNKNYVLCLPGRFMMDHIGQKACYMKLSVPCGCGRFWTVKSRFKMRGNQPDARIQSGWKSFVRENNLVEGDVCVFELIDGVKMHFQVTIFRAGKDPGFCHCLVKSEPGECSTKQVPPNPPRHEGSRSDVRYAATSNHISKNPSFKVIMTESRMRHMRATIPSGFLKHLKRSVQVVTFEMAGRAWCVKVCFFRRKPGREAFFSSGWAKFVRENSLQVGDVCAFELIERKEVVLKVSIHKKTLHKSCLND